MLMHLVVIRILAKNKIKKGRRRGQLRAGVEILRVISGGSFLLFPCHSTTGWQHVSAGDRTECKQNGHTMATCVSQAWQDDDGIIIKLGVDTFAE